MIPLKQKTISNVTTVVNENTDIWGFKKIQKNLGKHEGWSLGLQLNKSGSTDTEDSYNDKLNTTKFDKDTTTLKILWFFSPKNQLSKVVCQFISDTRWFNYCKVEFKIRWKKNVLRLHPLTNGFFHVSATTKCY